MEEPKSTYAEITYVKKLRTRKKYLPVLLIISAIYDIQFAYGSTNFVGGIAAQYDCTSVRYEFSWYEVSYRYEYLLRTSTTYPALPYERRQEGRHAGR